MEHAAICHPRRRRLELLTLHKNLLLLLMLMVMVAGLGHFPPHITPGHDYFNSVSYTHLTLPTIYSV